MIRSWIEIILNNGQRIKYVRDHVVNNAGDSAFFPDYYEYGDTIGDSLTQQGDTGQVWGDYTQLCASYLLEGDSYAPISKFLRFPESIGDTITLIRKNWDVPKTGPHSLTGGDTYLPVHRAISIAISSIATIGVVETWGPHDVYIPAV